MVTRATRCFHRLETRRNLLVLRTPFVDVTLSTDGPVELTGQGEVEEGLYAVSQLQLIWIKPGSCKQDGELRGPSLHRLPFPVLRDSVQTFSPDSVCSVSRYVLMLTDQKVRHEKSNLQKSTTYK